MPLVYNPKTGKTTGRSRNITDEERAARDKRLASGEYGILSEHPEQEEIDALLEQQEKYGVGWGIRRLIEAIRNSETFES